MTAPSDVAIFDADFRCSMIAGMILAAIAKRGGLPFALAPAIIFPLESHAQRLRAFGQKTGFAD